MVYRTAYCGGNIPLQNFADYYQYSPTVSSDGCSSKRDIPPNAIVARQSDDNGSCNQMLNICSDATDALTNPWNTPACLFGAACFGGQKPVDDFLAALSSKKNGSSTPTALDSPRVSSSVRNIYHRITLLLNLLTQMLI